MAEKLTMEQELSQWIRGAFASVFPGVDLGQLSPSVVPTADEAFGDYQCNACLALAKHLKQPPRAVAQAVVDGAVVPASIQKIEIAGPGFLNFTLKSEWLAEHLARVHADERLGTPAVGAGRTVVIDYSSPNVAKPKDRKSVV